MYQGNTNWIMITFHAQERPAQKTKDTAQGARKPEPTMNATFTQSTPYLTAVVQDTST